MDKRDFVTTCGELLRIAKPNLINREYKFGREITPTQFKKFISDDEYAVVTCENGCKYYVNITADTLMAIVLDIFRAMEHK